MQLLRDYIQTLNFVPCQICGYPNSPGAMLCHLCDTETDAEND